MGKRVSGNPAQRAKQEQDQREAAAKASQPQSLIPRSFKYFLLALVLATALMTVYAMWVFDGAVSGASLMLAGFTSSLALVVGATALQLVFARGARVSWKKVLVIGMVFLLLAGALSVFALSTVNPV